ncbi:hypothetical protein [Ehrlichia ruminantium]|uniref:Uncharacterized protein n=1 Tax=Ehrlichia ruminantium (strain Welgevonden) TaxID=254945 RepID=A0A0H3M7K9_EHRRW|nr:hypothetical protein [Ehrlichia ruminantium]QLK54788.1 hypothetical protein FDZ62_00675 [Ehrlichia ruminantium]QLK55706.1 hypothetical protein FDZ61_00675 [Ehrlichia ruminantium]UOD99809.1 hypothetical protein IMW62_00685 [Ehrlichia ruminantium]CAH57830.1 hypothetical protein Erum1150 [Ehrlichia ruminantium str. Welgevonden]CAI26606.1 Hypothetical protein ERWE_CDS_01120 [Ehrlichia ruminantium str. Welgevonden]
MLSVEVPISLSEEFEGETPVGVGLYDYDVDTLDNYDQVEVIANEVDVSESVESTQQDSVDASVNDGPVKMDSMFIDLSHGTEDLAEFLKSISSDSVDVPLDVSNDGDQLADILNVSDSDMDQPFQKEEMSDTHDNNNGINDEDLGGMYGLLLLGGFFSVMGSSMHGHYYPCCCESGFFS